MKKETNEENRKVNKKRIILVLLLLLLLISVTGITVGTLNSRENNNNDTVHTITFVNGNEEISIPQQVTGGKIPKPADPIKESTEEVSYKFDGWYTDAEFTQPFNFNTDTITKETTFYAKFTEIMNKYKVSFYVDDQLYGVVQHIEYGKIVTVPTNPTKESTAQFTYTFVGWYTDTEFTQPFNFNNDTITKETKLYAKFEATTNKYSVSFYVDGIEYTQVQSIEYGKYATNPEDPIKESTAQFTYTFVGWYTDTEFTQPFNFNNDTITKETKLYAKFEATTNKYSVSFFANDELYGDVQNVEYEGHATKPKDPPKASTAQFTYTFVGWYTDSELTQPFNFNTDTITKETKLYAKFEATTNKYSVSFYVDGIEYTQVQSIEYGNLVSKPTNPTKTNTDQFTYEFVGWYTDSELTQPFNFENDTITKETKLYAKFEATTNKYSVSFFANDELYGDVQNVEYEGHATNPEDPIKASTAQFTYTFVGWYTDAELQHPFNFGTDTITKDTKLYAKFEATTNKYAVLFYANGTQYGEAQNVEYEGHATNPEDPTKESTAQFTYTFVGWYTDAELLHSFNFGTDKITKETKLYAKFEATTNKYAVLFYANGSQYGDVQNVEYEGHATNPEDPIKESTAQFTYTFDGWYTEAELQHPFNFGTDKITKETKLYAKFEATTNKYAVLFYANGTQYGDVQNVEYEGHATNPGDPTKESTPQFTYTFEGWYTDSEPAKLFDFETDKITKETKLYAKFTEIDLVLRYTLNNDGASYSVTGTNKNVSEIRIPYFHEGKPVTSIGEEAFAYCSNLTSIIIADSVITIGAYAFSDNMNSRGRELTSVIIGNSVESIGAYAFYNCYKITNINIPDSVKTIGDRAFYVKGRIRSNLRSVTGGNGLESIGEYAFANCINLTNITIPEGATSIGNFAFWYCKSLTSIIIPSSVTSIGKGVLADCSALTSITVKNGNAEYYSINNCLIENKTKTIIAGCNTSVIPNDQKIESIGNSAFCGATNLMSVTIPEGVTSIGYAAFERCSSLTSLTIPNSVTSIDSSAFSQCSSLTSIIIPNSVTSIGLQIFSGCSSLISITIPEGVTSIGNSAFSYCSSLTSLTIPNSVTNIGDSAFVGCRSLTSLTIPTNVTNIGEYAFTKCYRLVEVYNLSKLTITKGSTDNGDIGLHAKDIYTSLEPKSKVISIEGGYKFYNDNGAYYLIGYYGDETELILPTGINGNSYSINDYAFADFIYLKSVTIPTYVTKIGYRAFSDCRSLTSTTFENVEGWYLTTNNNTTSGNPVTVSDSSQNATYLKSIYYNYYWYRKVM